MRMAISIQMDSKIRDLMTNSGQEDQALLESRALAAASLIDSRDDLDALMASSVQPPYPPPPPAIKITVREGGGVPPTPLTVVVDEGDNEKKIIRTVRDALRKHPWPS